MEKKEKTKVFDIDKLSKHLASRSIYSKMSIKKLYLMYSKKLNEIILKEVVLATLDFATVQNITLQKAYDYFLLANEKEQLGSLMAELESRWLGMSFKIAKNTIAGKIAMFNNGIIDLFCYTPLYLFGRNKKKEKCALCGSVIKGNKSKSFKEFIEFNCRCGCKFYKNM